jgi:FkbM family methyltransferase
VTLSVRSLAERLSRRVVLKRRMPARFGGDTIFVSPESGLRFFRRDLEKVEPGLFAWADEFVRKGDVVWDIGANLGVFTFAAAGAAGAGGRVVAVEADIWFADLIRRTVRSRRQGRAQVDVVPVAVSDAHGVARFNIAQRGGSTNHLEVARGTSETGGVRETVSVVTVTLDWLLDHVPAPRVVKIDVEGAEDRVLSGAARLLGQVKPIVICEVSDYNADTVTALLHGHGYSLFDLDSEVRTRPVERAVWSTLALPPAAHAG